MPRDNVKHVNVTEMLLQKRREQEFAEQQASERCDAAIETLALLCALGIILTFLIILVAYQEGLL